MGFPTFVPGSRNGKNLKVSYFQGEVQTFVPAAQPKPIQCTFNRIKTKQVLDVSCLVNCEWG